MPPRASGVLLKCRICLWYCLIQVVVEGGREGYSTTSVYNGMCGLVFQVEWHSSPSDDASISHDARLLRSHDATEWPAKACFELERKNGSFEQVSVSLSLCSITCCSRRPECMLCYVGFLAQNCISTCCCQFVWHTMTALCACLLYAACTEYFWSRCAATKAGDIEVWSAQIVVQRVPEMRQCCNRRIRMLLLSNTLLLAGADMPLAHPRWKTSLLSDDRDDVMNDTDVTGSWFTTPALPGPLPAADWLLTKINLDNNVSDFSAVFIMSIGQQEHLVHKTHETDISEWI